jgi:hypothetical protein
VDAYTKGLLLGFGLVMLSVVLAILIKQIQSGCLGLSHLSKSVEVPIDRVNLDFHKKFFRERLASLGFKPEDADGQFVQGGADLEGFGAGAHAKTKKLLTVAFRDAESERMVGTLTLRYAHVVGVDEGESAYCDAVLDFVSGKTDEMANVPRHSIMALNSLIGGVMSFILAVALVASDELGLWIAIPMLGITEFGSGLLALYSISRKPAEISGRWKAVAGILLSLTAICVGLYFIISKHSGPVI